MWKKKTKAGILLYALFLLAMFSLLLQFYLKRQLHHQESQLASYSKLEAYALASLTKENAVEKQGKMSFKQGQVYYSQEDEWLTLNVELSKGQEYQFTFPNDRKSPDEAREVDRKNS